MSLPPVCDEAGAGPEGEGVEGDRAEVEGVEGDEAEVEGVEGDWVAVAGAVIGVPGEGAVVGAEDTTVGGTLVEPVLGGRTWS